MPPVASLYHCYILTQAISALEAFLTDGLIMPEREEAFGAWVTKLVRRVVDRAFLTRAEKDLC